MNKSLRVLQVVKASAPIKRNLRKIADTGNWQAPRDTLIDNEVNEDCPGRKPVDNFAAAERQSVGFGVTRTTKLTDGLWLINSDTAYTRSDGRQLFDVKFGNYKIEFHSETEDLCCSETCLVKCRGEVKMDENSDVEEDLEGSKPRILRAICNGMASETEQTPEGKWGPVDFEVDSFPDDINVQFLVESKETPQELLQQWNKME